METEARRPPLPQVQPKADSWEEPAGEGQACGSQRRRGLGGGRVTADENADEGWL